MKEQLKNSRNLLFTALLRILVFLIIAIILFALGLMIGYAVLGEGKNPLDIFSKKFGIRFLDLLIRKHIN